MTESALRVVEGGMDKDKALEAALSQIERAFGKGSVMKLGQREQAVEIESISNRGVSNQLKIELKLTKSIKIVWNQIRSK